MASIKPLSEAVLSSVRSGFIISSLATVVEELIYNSLDAGARKVAILVGVNNGYIKVEDDGSGIDRDGLMLLGERYATSKVHHLNMEDDSVVTFGFRGEVLCSIADISLIEIVTKIQGRPNGYRKVMKGRKCLYLSIDDKQDVGTTVIVRDLFYNQPVRRRQLQSSTKKVLHAVRECVMRIALVQPYIAFRVVDMEREDELLCTHASASPLALLCDNFGIKSSTLCKLSFSEGLLKLTGYVSAPSSLLSSKAIQYMYVNSRFVVKGPIHKALTCLAEMCWDQLRGDKGGKRTLSHVASYCLNLACPRTSYDLNLEGSGASVEFKDWTPVIRFIEKSVAFFWSKRKRKEESSNFEEDEIQTNGMKKVVEDLSFSKNDWRLKTCQTTMKRRRTQNPENDKVSCEHLRSCMETEVEDSSSSVLWDSSSEQPKNSQSKMLKFKEPEKGREYSFCGKNAGDYVRESELFDKNREKSDVGLMQRVDNCTETYPCHTEWKDEISGDDLDAGSHEVKSGFDYEYKQDNDRTEDNHWHRKYLPGSPPWDNTLETPLNCVRLSGFQFDNYEATNWRSTSRGDFDGLGEYSFCGKNAGDYVRESELFDKNREKSDMGFMQRVDNSAETYPCHTEWKDEISGDDLDAGSHEVKCGFDYEFKQDNGVTEENHWHRKLLPGNPSWNNTLETPPSCVRLSGFQFDSYEATSWRSTSRGDFDGLGEDPDVFQRSSSQRDVGNTLLLPKVDTESHVWKYTTVHSLPSCVDSSYRQPKYLSDKVSDFRRSCSQLNFGQNSPVLYPFVDLNDWEFDNLANIDGAERTSERRNRYGFYLPDDDEKEEFCQDALGDRCIDVNLSYVTSLNTKLGLEESGYAGVESGTLEFPIDNCSFDYISSMTHDGLLAQETNLSSSDIMMRDPSFYWSPSVPINRGVKMDQQICQTLDYRDIRKDGPLKSNRKCYPDSPLYASSDGILMGEVFSSSPDFKSKFNVYEPSGHCFPSTSTDEDLRIDILGCQSVETNHSSPKQIIRSSTRTRSHSSPPIHRSKRRFVSVGDCLTPAIEYPVLERDPQINCVSERATLEHSRVARIPCNEYNQDDEMTSEEGPHFWIDHQMKGVPTISEDKMLSQNVKAGESEVPESLKEIQDPESSRVKWREGCQDTALKRINNCRRVTDSLDEFKVENRILDVQSCMLYLAGDSLIPKSINRTCLESAKVLFQVERKFIPVVGNGILAVVDQHAADERIRLEEMRQKVLSGELMSITYLEEEKELVLPEIGYQLLCNYAESIQHWGWICNIFHQESGSFSKNLDLLNGQASHVRLLAVPCVLGVKLSDADLLEYLEQLADTDGSSTMPPSVVRILNYKACRGAIMFGDKLLLSECSLIVEELKRTSLCLQCAHGRPTTVPLVNLKALHKWVRQLGSSSHEGSKMAWHGLCRNDISVERAKHRLDVARGC